jgi:diguanylate cyclase (GGDEF)-like protein
MTDGAAGVLVIASRPALRRALLHVLEGAAQGGVHFAQDLPQLRALLHAAPALSLVVLAAEVDLDEALISAHYLRSLPGYADVPLLVLLPDGVLNALPTLPPGPTDMLGLGRLEQELLPRWRRLIASAGNAPISPAVLLAESEAERALALLARMSGPGGGDEGLHEAAQWLVDGLQLDYLSIWSRGQDESALPVLGLRIWRGAELTWPAPERSRLLRQALAGQTLLYPHDAQREAVDDPLPGLLGLVGFAAWPILDQRHNTLGALLVGARRPLSQRLLPVLLQSVASRFGHKLELQHARDEAQAKGLLDGLTGLPNRLLFHDRLETTIREARRTGESFAVMLLDIDHFQRINDRHGHDAGNRVLQTAAQRLQAALRTSDTVARYMGDEFTVVLRHIAQREDVLRVAEKVVQAMALPLHPGEGSSLPLSVSVGVSFFPVDAADAESLLEHASEAMHAAKRLGRNNVQLYAPGLEVSQQQRQALKSQLRHAQQNDELRVYYQPQVDARTEDIIGMEALLRWEHPQLGSIGPSFFVPLAEESGLIVSIGEWALQTACRQAHAWQRRYGLRLRLGINLSAVQLMHPNLLSMITDALHESGLDAQLLELEVTESLSVKAIPHLLETLQALRTLGCSVAIDDFGTGAASLDYLRRLPANRIKIDQSFVRNIGIDPDDEAIVRATVDIAHRLKRSVIAEGVEVEQHLQFLRATGCDELQGYLFCRPLPSASFEHLLSEREQLLENALSASLA